MDEQSAKPDGGRNSTKRSNRTGKRASGTSPATQSATEPVPTVRPARIIPPQISLEIDGNDANRQEEMAQLDLFRSISIGKMIAVVGSGVTTTYGYDTWAGMLRRLVSKLKEMSEQNADNCFNEYGKEQAAKFFKSTNSANDAEDYNFAVYGSLYPLLTDFGKSEIHKEYQQLFGARTIVRRDSAKKAFPDASIPDTNDDYLPQDFSHFLSAFATVLDRAAIVSGGENRRMTALTDGAIKSKADSRRIAADRNFVDPLERMRSSLRIRRFATFNYDQEIEYLLEDYDYPYGTLTAEAEHKDAYDRPQHSSGHDRGVTHGHSRLGSVARSVSLSPRNASELISLAAVPADDDEMVVHLHGAVTQPDEMVVTPQDYDAVYIEQHPQRNAYEDARKLMFGGNSILYVGVGMREEDVLRPLRYLASVVSERPIYALIPSLESHKKDLSLKKKIKDAYRINAISYGPGHTHVPRIVSDLGIEHPLGRDFIALHDEVANIGEFVTDALFGTKKSNAIALSRKTAPRLYQGARPFFEFLARLPDIARGSSEINGLKSGQLRQMRTSHELQEFVSIVKSVATSVALNNVIELMSLVGRRWRDAWRIRRKASTEGLPPEHINNLHVIHLLNHVRHDRDQASKNLQDALSFRGPISVVLFDDGRGMSSFSSLAKTFKRATVRSGDGTESKRVGIKVHMINMNHVVAANSILPLIHSAIKHHAANASEATTHVFLISDAEKLMDHTGTQVQNLATLYFLYSLRSLSNEESVLGPFKIILLSRRKRTALKLEEMFGHGSLIPVGYRRQFEVPRLDATAHRATAEICRKYRWSNLVVSAICERFQTRAERLSVLDLLESFLDAKIQSVDIKNRQSVFFGAVLDALHAHAQRNMSVEDRVGLVAQHAILKWMFVIRIPVDCASIIIVPEIIGIWDRYQTHVKSGIGFGAFIQKQIEQLHKLNFVHEISQTTTDLDPVNRLGPGMKSTRFVLHDHAARYLAHKRGISAEWMDHREWNSASLCNAMMDGGPLLSEDDYASSCDVYEALLKDGRRRPLQCAYAIIRGHLYGPNAMRAGLMYPNRGDSRSAIDTHVGRLSRLRTQALNLKTVGDVPTHFEHFEVWVTNEIGALKYAQGDIHDAVMLFRECLYFIKSEGDNAYHINGDRIDYDPAIVPRIRINLSMALIERAQFEQAEKLINSVIARLDTIDITAHYPMEAAPAGRESAAPMPATGPQKHASDVATFLLPESMLLRSLALGCRAQIELLTADIGKALQTIDEAIEHVEGFDLLGVRGWLYGLNAQIASSSGNIRSASAHWKKSLAAARGSLRPDLVLSLEVAEIGYRMRVCKGDRATVLDGLSTLFHLEKSARALGSYIIRVEILLIRARALIYLEQTEVARDAVIDAICLSLLNGMRLKRVTGLVLMVALMAQRGEHAAAKKLLRTVRMSASRLRFVSASLDIDRLDRAINMEGNIPPWAGYLLDPISE